ncbi:MAG: exopolysaccharide biosynthesis protein [Rhodospirillales bacterium]|nr:exopolysaccharide biosynthesis protein [Rhodospirillales bacterium]
MSEIRSLSQLMTDLKHSLSGDDVRLGTLLEQLHERGFGAVLLLFAAPMALPIPVPPGINIALATPLLLLTAQQVIGRHTIWLPEKLRQSALPRTKIEGLIDAMLPWLKRLELLTKPRMGWITQNGPSCFFGFLGLLMALAVCVPVPLTNTVPSLGIALMAVGTLMRDGLATLVGAIIGMAWVTMLVGAVIIFGPEAFDIVKETIKSFL